MGGSADLSARADIVGTSYNYTGSTPSYRVTGLLWDYLAD